MRVEDRRSLFHTAIEIRFIHMKSIIRTIYKSIPLKKQFYTLLRSVYKPSEEVYKFFIFWDKFRVKVKDKFFWLKHNGLHIENEIFWGGLTGSRFEKLSMQLWIHLCADVACVMDIGANTGIYSLVTKALNPTAQVYAFEPISRTFKKLMHNNQINNFDITCEQIAVSDKDGISYIFDPLTEHNNLATLSEEAADSNRINRKTQTTIKKLSTYISEHNIAHIDLMKIDVEGHEPSVLIGMEEHLYIMQPTLLIEINSDAMGKKIEEIIKGIDYLYFNIDEQARIDLVPHLVKSYHNNYLICKPEIAKRLNLIKKQQ
jgi:FkbM family methyltransferase